MTNLPPGYTDVAGHVIYNGELDPARMARRAEQQQKPSGGSGGHGGSGGIPAGGGGGSPASAGAQNGSPMFDIWGTSSGYITQRLGPAVNWMEAYLVEGQNALRVDVYINDLSAGFDSQIIVVRPGLVSGKLAESTLDHSFANTLQLPSRTTFTTSADFELGELDAISSCVLNDGGTMRWLVAGGDVANKSLFTMGDTLTAQTYTPGSNIISLTTVKLVTNTERVIVGLEGAAAHVLTGIDGSPTDSGAMHANTANLWGAIRTTLNSTTPGYENILLYCNGGLYILASNAGAIDTAPTLVLSGWPDGGYAGGIITATTDNVARAYWAHPLNDLSVSALASAGAGQATQPLKLISTNLEGLDPREIDVGMPWFIHGLKWRNGWACTNGKAVHWWTGDIINLGWNKERRWDDSGTTYVGTIQSLEVVEDRLFAIVAYTGGVSNTVVKTIREEFIPENNDAVGGWYFHSLVVSAAGVLPNVAKTTGRTPFYQPYDTVVDSGRLWTYTQVDGGLTAATYEWSSIPLIAPGVNPFFNQEEGPHVNYEYGAFEETNTSCHSILPVMHFFPGLPKVWADMWYGGQLVGEDAKVKFEHAVQSASAMVFGGDITCSFREDDDWKTHFYTNPDPKASWQDREQIKVTMYQATSGTYKTQTSSNALPFRMGYYVYLDGVYKEPHVMEPDRYRGMK